MSPFSLIAPADESGLARYGYSAEEASFLGLAALHSGYFLRRQVAHFFGCRDGSRVTQLVQRLLALGHSRSSTWRQNIQLYHLCSRPFYQALGEPNNRNRRQHELAQIKNRVMGLDFVLAHRNVQFLATEREKLDYFDSLEIDREKLPKKVFRSRDSRESAVRFFIDKYPVFFTDATERARRALTFTFVDEGLVTLSRFERYLAEYRPLFESLADLELVYVAGTKTHFAAARALFERFCVRNAHEGGGTNRYDREQLVSYFELRKRFEDRQFTSFDRGQLLLLRDAKETFGSQEFEALYRAWRSAENQETSAVLREDASPEARMSGAFRTELLTHDYSIFDHFLPR